MNASNRLKPLWTARLIRKFRGRTSRQPGFERVSNNFHSHRQFQAELDDAIADRRALDSFVSSPEALSVEDRLRWHRECRLDEAIAAWRREHLARRLPLDRPTPPRLKRLLAATVALGVLGLIWWSAAPDNRETNVRVALNAPTTPAPRSTSTDRAPASSASPTSLVSPPQSHLMVSGAPMVRHDPARDREAQRAADLSERARRLTHAIEPVGRRVGALWERMINALPGASVWPEWTYDT